MHVTAPGLEIIVNKLYSVQRLFCLCSGIISLVSLITWNFFLCFGITNALLGCGTIAGIYHSGNSQCHLSNNGVIVYFLLWSNLLPKWYRHENWSCDINSDFVDLNDVFDWVGPLPTIATFFTYWQLLQQLWAEAVIVSKTWTYQLIIIWSELHDAIAVCLCNKVAQYFCNYSDWLWIGSSNHWLQIVHFSVFWVKL